MAQKQKRTDLAVKRADFGLTFALERHLRHHIQIGPDGQTKWPAEQIARRKKPATTERHCFSSPRQVATSCCASERCSAKSAQKEQPNLG